MYLNEYSSDQLQSKNRWLNSNSALVEELVIGYITDTTKAALEIGKPNKITLEDITYVIRKDKRKGEPINVTRNSTVARRLPPQTFYSIYSFWVANVFGRYFWWRIFQIRLRVGDFSNKSVCVEGVQFVWEMSGHQYYWYTNLLVITEKSKKNYASNETQTFLRRWNKNIYHLCFDMLLFMFIGLKLLRLLLYGLVGFLLIVAFSNGFCPHHENSEGGAKTCKFLLYSLTNYIHIYYLFSERSRWAEQAYIGHASRWVVKFQSRGPWNCEFHPSLTQNANLRHHDLKCCLNLWKSAEIKIREPIKFWLNRLT